MKNILANELSNIIASGKSIDLIDVRTPIEYRSMHIAVARNEPLDRLDPQSIRNSQRASATQPLYVVCRSGGRSRQACEKLLASGLTNIINVEGGTTACVAAGIPVVRGKKTMPLHCQVQIITGFAVLIGAVAAALSGNFLWLILPVVMGSGLIFSGLTDTCAMGMMLARLPWNQVKPNVDSCTVESTNMSSTRTISGCCR